MKTSLWLNVDPLALYNPIFEDEFYFDGQHNGGVFNDKNLNPYGYCYQNPILLVDPNGKQAISGALTGFVVGALSEVVAQVGYNMFVNKYSLESSMSKIYISNVVVAASIGGLTGSITGGYDKIAKLVSDPRAQKVIQFGIEKVIDLVAHYRVRLHANFTLSSERNEFSLPLIATKSTQG